MKPTQAGHSPLATEELGEGRPLLLLHGLGANRSVWRDVAPRLADRRRVIAADLPGFGESPPAGRGFELSEAADVIAAEIAERDAGDLDLVGHSLGGAVALTVAGRHPDLVRRLVLCAPAGFRPRSEPLAQTLAAALPPFLATRRLLGRRMVGSTLGRRALLFGALHDAGRLSPDQALAMLDASRSAVRLREAARAAIAADLGEDFATVPVPVGLLWGERDLLLPSQGAETMAGGRPGTPVETIPGAGHVAQLERPAEFAAALERLLERLPAQR